MIHNASDVLQADLNFLARSLEGEFAAMRGKRLLISGGAGFLGYYLVQSVLHWNQSQDPAAAVRVVVCDNYARGVPAWLTQLQDNPALTLLRHDITQPLPETLG